MASSFIIWGLYSIFEGIREAIFYHYKNHNIKRLFNEHIIFTIQRGIVFIILILLSKNILLLISFILCFSFIHNGSYYTMRNILNKEIYKRKWFDQSTTSTSFWTKYMTPLNRTILFIVSLGVLFFNKSR